MGEENAEYVKVDKELLKQVTENMNLSDTKVVK